MDKTLLYYNQNGELLTFENYTINEKGVVKIKHNNKKRKYCTTSNGYYCCKLSKNGVKINCMIHRAVLSTFDTDGYFKDAQVNHIDENKKNNNLNNLEWLSSKDNCSHGQWKEKMLKNRGGKSAMKPVLCYDLNNNFIKEYESTMATEKDGFNHQCVINCCKGKQKKHKNHKFYYKNS